MTHDWVDQAILAGLYNGDFHAIARRIEAERQRLEAIILTHDAQVKRMDTQIVGLKDEQAKRGETNKRLNKKLQRLAAYVKALTGTEHIMRHHNREVPWTECDTAYCRKAVQLIKSLD